jgi:hypothetical protein
MAFFTPDVAGAYTFQLTVNNGTFSSSSNVTITATGGTVTNPAAHLSRRSQLPVKTVT